MGLAPHPVISYPIPTLTLPLKGRELNNKTNPQAL